MYGYIYKTTNSINGKIYIGKHKSDEFDPLYKGSGSYLWRAINKYGWNNFYVEMLCPCFSLEELNSEEIFLIDYFNSRDHQLGYNLMKGGDGGALYGELNSFYNKHHTPEIRRIISSVLKCNWKNSDYRDHQHNVRLGNQNSAGTIWIHKGDQNKRANPSNLDYYLEEGWELGCSEESSRKKAQASIGRRNNLGKVRIHKDNVGKMVDEFKLQDYLDKGWKLGMNPASAQKRLGKSAPPNRKYHLTCELCGVEFLGSSPRIRLCPNCKSE